MRAISLHLHSGTEIMGTTCAQTPATSYYENQSPPYGLQGEPGCDVTSDDDACVVCAKGSCCTEYVACVGDVNCTCLVGCLYQGNTGLGMSQSGVRLRLHERRRDGELDVPRHDPLRGLVQRGLACMHPGAAGGGEGCFSDADCASCSCNTGTMTCD